MLVCAFLHIFARETAGAARTRLSLRPLFEEGGKKQQNPGETRRGNYMHVKEIVIASAAKQSISPRKERMDRFACVPRNDGGLHGNPRQKFQASR
jgi:hypothetical protein